MSFSGRVVRRLRLRPAAVLAAFALVATGCGVSLQSLPKPSGVSGPTYTLHATFADVVNLPEDAEVRVGAFSVGYVSTLDAKNFKALVTMKIKKSQKLPVGTSAQIRFDTPLGDDYVSLVPPSTAATGALLSKADTTVDYLVDGGSIPETQTTTAPSVEDVFAALGALLNGGGIDQLQTIIHELNAALGGNQTQIHTLLSELNTTVSSFAAHAPQLDSALQQVAQLSTVLNANSATIVAGINALAPAVSDLKDDNATLNQLVDQIHTLSSVANGVVVQSQTGLTETLRSLSPVLTQLTQVQGVIGPALDSINAFEVRTPAVAPGNYLQVALTTNVDVPPVPGDAPKLNKITVDPPDPNQS